MFFFPLTKLTIVGAALLWASYAATQSLTGAVDVDDLNSIQQCPSGQAAAKLTGWPLNGKNPVGDAKYDEVKQVLEVSVDLVALPDGRVLSILIGEDRIGEMQPLKDGKSSGSVTRAVPHDARVRVFDADRPIVSANLRCVEATQPPANPQPTVTPWPSPSASPSPSPSPSASPSPSPSPGPTTEPTPDPMPKPSPAPSPSPQL